MAKGNLFLGYARGKVGDVVFSRQNGEQVTRARNRAPRNPQSALQMLQRVVMKTSSTAYSMMRPICDHSFQGRAEGTPCQSRFAELNVALMRDQLRLEINAGDSEAILTSQETNFADRSSAMPKIRPYQIAEGTIPPIVPSYSTSLFAEIALEGASVGSEFTYQEICDKLHLQRGDQLTVVLFTVDDRTGEETSEWNSMAYGRVILEPSNGDMTTAFIDPDTGSIMSPNERNEGGLTFSYGTSKMTPIIPLSGTGTRGARNSFAGCAVIVSRLVGGVWQRSNASVVIPDASLLQVDHDIATLQDALASYVSVPDSTLYLNQAE